MIQIKNYSLDEAFAAMDNRGILPDGNKFSKNSARMILFRDKGPQCVTCKLSGNVFILETQREDVPPHLNLYAKAEDGKLTLMTKDHIHPKSKGGANTQENYQTMCTDCNRKKSNKVEATV